MTYEKFERACEIQAYREAIMELQDLLDNAQEKGSGTRYLAAIDVEKFDPSGYVVEDCNILNHINIPVKIMKQFKDILQAELSKSSEEFDEL